MHLVSLLWKFESFPYVLAWTAGILPALAAALAFWRRRESASATGGTGRSPLARLTLPGRLLVIIAAVVGLAALLWQMMEVMFPEHAELVAQRLSDLQAEVMRRRVLSQPRYRDPRRLNHFELKVYSQAGEDGIIREIFNRIGVTNKFFVEFGSGDGEENNTVLLLRSGWTGVWMDGNQQFVDRARTKFAQEIKSGRLTVLNAFVTAENIEELFGLAGIPPEFDLLSVDIDRNDYWVWSKVERYRPRAAVVEYNSFFPPGTEWVIPYDPQGVWDGTIRFGASLRALEKLGRKKGYLLVGCNLGGVNAFFVREELVGSRFSGPFTVENLFEPPGRPLAPRRASR